MANTATSFREAWISLNGKVIFEGDSHQRIAEKHILSLQPELQNSVESDGVHWWDYCYEWMYNNGYARLARYGSVLYVTTGREKEHGKFIATLHERAVKLGKKMDMSTVECDHTGKTLWSNKDLL